MPFYSNRGLGCLELYFNSRAPQVFDTARAAVRRRDRPNWRYAWVSMISCVRELKRCLVAGLPLCPVVFIENLLPTLNLGR
jgi:hypothetical protein